MAGERAQNLQDTFLNYVRKHKIPLTIFLVNGVKLQGVVTWFDSFCVLLRRDGHSQLVYKHAISTVMPARRPISIASRRFFIAETRPRKQTASGSPGPRPADLASVARPSRYLAFQVPYIHSMPGG